MLLLAPASHSAAGPPGLRVSQTFPPPPHEKLHPNREICHPYHEIYATIGGSLVVPINAPHLFAQ